MSVSLRGDGNGCISASASEKKHAYGERAERLLPNWRCTLSEGATTQGGRAVFDTRGRTLLQRHSLIRRRSTLLTKGLELLTLLPETPERAQHELALQIALGVPLHGHERL